MNNYPYYYLNTPQYYRNIYPVIQQQRHVDPYYTPYYLTHEVHPINLGPIRPNVDELIQEDATCVAEKTGPKLGDGHLDVGIYKIRYEAYECQIILYATAVGIDAGRKILKRGIIHFEWEIPTYTASIIGSSDGIYKLVGWMIGKELWMRYEYRSRGNVKYQIKPFRVDKFPRLRFWG